MITVNLSSIVTQNVYLGTPLEPIENGVDQPFDLDLQGNFGLSTVYLINVTPNALVSTITDHQFQLRPLNLHQLCILGQ